VKAALAAGVLAVQYRNKEASTLAMCEEADSLARLCSSALFLVNDRLDVALAVCADGVHIGQDDMPYARARKLLGTKRIIGVTVHNAGEALDAEAAGADYVGVSPIFFTGTKPDAGVPVGIEMLALVKSKIRIPVVAIGGITPGNAPLVVSSGADALCAISSVVGAEDPAAVMIKFQEMFYDADRKRAQ
jgi:thiamine-phosphate pyrophosphorylase